MPVYREAESPQHAEELVIALADREVLASPKEPRE